MSIHLLVLNYNGCALLAECLPSVLRAAAQSQHRCRVSVVDNSSSDDSCRWLRDNYPEVTIYHRPNDGLCSFNTVLAELDDDVVLLLNNDIRLADDAIDPWVTPLLESAASAEPVWMTAPRAWLFDGVTYEGFRTSVSWHWGLIRATARFPQAEQLQELAGETALAGAALAVDRRKFLELGGFDPLYLPGRIEDVDLAYRAFQAGYIARYVPQARVWHRGEASFAAALGWVGSYRLALRNTLLFQVKQLRQPGHVCRAVCGIPLRLAADVLRAPWQRRELRFAFTRALFAALPHVGAALRSTYRGCSTLRREAEFFRRYSIPQLTATARGDEPHMNEAGRWSRHPVSRWYLPTIVEPLVNLLAPSAVRPNHVTTLGLLCAGLAMTLLSGSQSVSWGAAVLVWLAWLCDRTDGPLARRQNSATTLGARFDAVTDECVDLGLHGALAVVAASQTNTPVPYLALFGFILGKLAFHRLTATHSALGTPQSALPTHHFLRTLYHLPGNTDIRVHLLLAALITGQLTLLLVFLAAYYNLRWLVVWGKAWLRPAPIMARQLPKGAVS